MSDVIPLVAACTPAALYASGTIRLWRRAGVGRGLGRADVLCGCSGFGLLIALLLSPMHHWSEESFAVHMIEHELLMVVIATLIMLGKPLMASRI